MSPERRAEIESLFEQALNLTSEQRADFLDTACSRDEELRSAVERLLEAYDQAPDFLDGNAGALISDEVEKDKKPMTGRVIGAYRLEERIGAGGMGVVYRASRADGSFEQTVALKLLPRFLETTERVARFRMERQILARLNHPNIARLLDGGVTDEGYPYLVMEYVDGRSITEYAQENGLSLRERIGLLLDVLRALRYAHTNLIVHRDIKPANILVTDDGDVKLLDFGIAKLLDATDAPEDRITRTAQQLLTPEYAAPEQIMGEPITTATDVYQVGVLAYELLAGEMPFRLKGKTPSEIQKAIVESEPTKPSAAATGVGRSDKADARSARNVDAKQLKGDLDTVVLKAMRKEPERRYPEADGFASDLRRYLSGHPVSARPSTWRYRSGKFIARHRWGVATAAVVTVVIAALFAIAMQQRYLALYERDRAQHEASKAEQVSDFLVGLFEAGNPFAVPIDEESTIDDVMERGLADIETLDNQPSAQASMYEALSRAYVGLGDYTKADSLARRSLEIREATFDPPDLSIASALDQRATVLEKMGKYTRSEEYARRSLAMRQELLDPPHELIASSLNGLALTLKEQGKLEKADSLYREALIMRRTVHGDEHADVASTLTNIGMVAFERGRFKEAEEYHEEALAINRVVFGDSHPQTALSLNNRALAVQNQGRYAEAEPLFRETLEISTAVLGDEHPHVATVTNNLAVVIEEQGRMTESGELKKKALHVTRAALGENHPTLAARLNNLGVHYLKMRDYREAERYFQETLELLERTVGLTHQHAALTMGSLARAVRYTGDIAEARELAERSLNLIRDHFGEEHPRTAAAISILANIHSAEGDHEEAVSLHTEALEMRKSLLGDNHPSTATSYHYAAREYAALGDCAAAIPAFEAALSIRGEAFGEEDTRTALSQLGLGECLFEERNYEAAEPLLASAYEVFRKSEVDFVAETTRAALTLAEVFEQVDRHDEALQYRAAVTM